MGKRELKKWVKELSLKDRLTLQKFVVRLYSIEKD